jgi:hypothetical protein
MIYKYKKIFKMKKFLSIEKFQELKVLFTLEIIMGLILIMLICVNKFDINYWDWRALLISIGIWSLSSIVDKEKYFNFATLLGTGSFMYLIWWFVFNL